MKFSSSLRKKVEGPFERVNFWTSAIYVIAEVLLSAHENAVKN